MNKIQKRRLYLVVFFVLSLALASSLILYALKQNINVFLTPSQITSEKIDKNYHFRMGGVVKPNSILRSTNNLNVKFIVTDFKKEITVAFNGVLPDLFHEGKGVIVEGYLNSENVFIADQVLAKHDENYMPKNVYKALRENNK